MFVAPTVTDLTTEAEQTAALLRVDRPTLATEAALVVGIAVGLSAARSVLDFVSSALAAATAKGGLAAKSATLNASAAPGQPWVDLGFQLLFVVGMLLPVLLAIHLVVRSGGTVADIGLRTERWRRDVTVGLGIAAGIGGLGLAAYLGSHAAGASLTVVPTSLPAVWWRDLVLVLAACGNAVLEEVVLVGYLLSRLERLGVSPRRALAVSAGIRAAYHLYQGLAGFLANLLMGLVFGRLYQRTRTVVPLVVAHALIDIVAFVGYAELAGRVSWLPVAH
jgi:membrane protease YdiL (CAAX protease family)